MGILLITKRQNFFTRMFHKLFQCPTFWQSKPKFTCPICGRHYRCYWDGNDVLGFINVCMKCFPVMDRIEKIENQ